MEPIKLTSLQLEVVKHTLEYQDEGQVFTVYNNLTGVTDTYTVELKKVLTKSKNWDEKLTKH